MNLKASLNSIGKLLELLGLFMLIPAVCSLIYKENDLWAFIISAAVTALTGLVIERITRSPEEKGEIGRKDGFVIATLSWLLCAFFGSLPYIIAGVFKSPIDAFFESASGFTTTGASVLTNIEVFPHGVLFWRDFTHWLGGMGIIVLAIAILPGLSVGGMQLMGLEAPGPTTERLKPRIAETAKALWKVYMLISALEVLFLVLAGMPLFDALVHMFGTMGTGGFSSKNLSIAAYGSPLIETVIIVFMFLAGANFVLHYSLLRGDYKRIITDSEFRFYLLLTLGAILVITIELWMRMYPNFFQALRYGAFQVVSIGTTTGYATDNFDVWPSYSRGLLFILMFVGGCAGSTGGSMKIIRVLVLLKKGYMELYRLIYPRAVIPLRVGKKALDESIESGITSFFLLYMAIFVLSSLILMIQEVPFITSISAVAATMGNIGPGLELVGPMANYAHFSSPIKLLLSFLMILGRLEIYTVLVLFVPAFWRR